MAKKFTKFASPESQGRRQAASIMKRLQGNEIQSVGTVRNYEQALKQFCTYLAENKQHIKDIGEKEALSYLNLRSEEVSQKTLDMDRQAIQKALQVTGAIQHNLTVIKSENKQELTSRFYTSEQVKIIADKQTEKFSLATQIAYSAGLRARELLTLERADIRPADNRPARPEKFNGRDGELYTVRGKGGLIREVLIPTHLAERLEQLRLDTPKTVTDRNIFYNQSYDIRGGQAFTRSFGNASKNNLGWSTGAHGLRHSYAQERMDELQKLGISREIGRAHV